MKVLHLTLKKCWFDMIKSGEKKEEYRELKPYWASRLTILPPEFCKRCNIYDLREHTRDYDMVVFKNGYSKDAPTIMVKCGLIAVDKGNPDWGAEPGKEYFVIKLGEQLSL